MQDLEKNPWEAYPTYRNVAELAERNARRNVWDIQYRRVLSVWPWMLGSALACFILTGIVLRYITDKYEVSSSIVVEENQEITLGQALFNSRDPLNDQIAVLRSPTLARRVVDSMGLQYHAKIEGKFKDKELYKNIAWKVIFKPQDDARLLQFTVQPDSTGFSWKSGSLKGRAKWGEAFTIDAKVVQVSRYKFFYESPFLCYETDPMQEAFSLSSRISVRPTKESRVVDISFRDIVPARAVEIVDRVIKTYKDYLFEDKSKSLEQSIVFIQNRLVPLSDELDSIETRLAGYKSTKGFVGMSANGELYLQKTQEYDQQLNEVELQKSILNAVEAFLKNPDTRDDQLSLIGISDTYMQGLITQFQQLRLEREKLAVTAAETNPQLQILDKRLAEIRGNIEVQLNNYRKNIKLAEDNYRRNISFAKSLLTSTPREEKQLLEQMRQQNIKQSLFLLLLQKKEEAAVALSSVSVKTSILRPATIPSKPVAPPRTEILLGAFFIGLWIPLIITLVREFLNNKLISKSQLQQMMSAPVISELDLVENSDRILEVKRKDRSIFGEQIRALRTNLRYYYGNTQPFYILITSSMSGEGKSFISANLAASYALQGKRVALLEFDLRRPKLRTRFGLDKKGPGISTVLIGRDKPEDIAVNVFPDGVLHLIPSGPVPPNPSELMAGDGMQVLKDYLDKNYDVVIIDTPPYGIVADAQLLSSWAQVALIITRFRMTIREQIHEVEEWNRNGIFKQMAVVFNGIRTKGYYGYKYGYYYTKRKYGSAYYLNEKKEVEEEDGKGLDG